MPSTVSSSSTVGLIILATASAEDWSGRVTTTLMTEDVGLRVVVMDAATSVAVRSAISPPDADSLISAANASAPRMLSNVRTSASSTAPRSLGSTSSSTLATWDGGRPLANP